MLDPDISLRAGLIFIWNHYPFFTFEEKDRRWFLFLGDDKISEFVFQVTATTKTEYYVKGGRRQHNNFFELKSGDGGLEKDCIIDLTHHFESLTHNSINTYKKEIDLKSMLSQEKVNILVKRLECDRDIIRITKKTIYQRLRESGFRVSV